MAIVIVFLADMGRIPCCGRPESSSSITLVTRINDPVRIKLTRCKKRANFYARVTEIGSEHKGNRYQAFATCKPKLKCGSNLKIVKSVQENQKVT